ncbi:MAG: hypothetical protein ACI80K_002539, partial [Paracoccaceae bacterium]
MIPILTSCLPLFGLAAQPQATAPDVSSGNSATLETFLPAGSAELSELAAPAGLLQGAIRDLPVLYDDAAEPGRILSAGQGWKADFGPSGLDYTPVLGQSAAVDQVTSFELRAVTVGGEAFAFEPGDVSRAGDSVTLDRGSMREVYHLDTKTVEQTFVFDELPSAGDLVVEVGVKSPWAVQADDASIRFVDPSF